MFTLLFNFVKLSNRKNSCKYELEYHLGFNIKFCRQIKYYCTQILIAGTFQSAKRMNNECESSNIGVDKVLKFKESKIEII